MTDRYNKILAIAILSFVILLAWLLFIKPYFAIWEERIGKAEILHKKHISLMAMIENRDLINQQYRSISNNRGLREVFLDIKSGPLADIKLQGIIKRAISESGGRVVQSLLQTKQKAAKNSPSATGDDKSVTVEVLMEGSIDSIYSTLHRLENSRPLIVISHLEISHNQARYRGINQTSDGYYRAKYNVTAFIL